MAKKPSRRANAKKRPRGKKVRTPARANGKKGAASSDKALRRHLLKLLDWRDAHVNFEAVVADWPSALSGAKLIDLPYTPWQVLEHLRIAQRDILDFCRSRNYKELEFPAGYWPATKVPPDEAAWEKSVQAFRADLNALMKLVADPGIDLFAPLPNGTGQTLLREALLVADHNAYHLGQLALLRRLLGAWPSA